MFIAELLFQRGFCPYAEKELVSLHILLIQQISRTFWHCVNSACPMPSREGGNSQTPEEMSVYKVGHQKA